MAEPDCHRRDRVGVYLELLMLTRSLNVRLAAPSFLMSLLFLGSSLGAAAYLHHRLSTSLRALDESLEGCRIAAELLRDLEALPSKDPADEDTAHRGIVGWIGRARRFAEGAEERRLVDGLEEGFDLYLRSQLKASAEPGKRDGPSFLEAKLIPAGRQLERFKSAERKRSERALQRIVASTAWGLVSVGV
ncbi:sensor histidine kinase, partial [Singulisphaera rosea]